MGVFANSQPLKFLGKPKFFSLLTAHFQPKISPSSALFPPFSPHFPAKSCPFLRSTLPFLILFRSQTRKFHPFTPNSRSVLPKSSPILPIQAQNSTIKSNSTQYYPKFHTSALKLPRTVQLLHRQYQNHALKILALCLPDKFSYS